MSRAHKVKISAKVDEYLCEINANICMDSSYSPLYPDMEGCCGKELLTNN